MALLKFLKGNYAGLSAKAISEGQVLICGDTGEMFVDVAADKRVKIGDFVVVSDIQALEALDASSVPTSRLYYVENGNILARSDGTSWTQINKQKTLAQLGGVSLETYNTKMAALETADTNNSTAISNLSTYVGTIPETATATNIVAYVQEKTAGIATDTALEELTGRVATAEGDIDKLEASLAEGGATANAIAEAKAAGDNAQADVDALELKVGTVAEGKTVVGLIGEAQTKAEQGVTDAATAQARADEAYTLADGKATMDQVNTAIENAGHAVKSDVDQAIADLDAAYKAADSALETKLQGNIDKKADQTTVAGIDGRIAAVEADYLKAADKTELEGKISAKVAQTDYDTKVKALDDEDDRLEGLISAMDTAYKAADTALDGRIATLEGTITGLSGAMHFKGVKSELPTDVTGYADGDVIIVGDKEYVFNGGAFVELGDVSAEGDRISALEVLVGEYDDEGKPVDGLVKDVADNAAAIIAEKDRAEAKEAELSAADATNLQAAKDYADDAVEALNIAQYAKQADLDSHTDDAVVHITADERTAWNAAESNAKTYAKDYADGLNTAMNTRVEALEAVDHEHANKTELDLIASGDKAKWDAAEAKAHEHANKTVIDGITAEKVSAWDSAEANAKAYADQSELDAIAAAKTETETQVGAEKTAREQAVASVQGALDTYKTSNDAAVAGKADKATTLAGYGITDAMTADAINALFQWGEF